MRSWKNGTLWDKTRYSLAGLRDAIRSERAVRNELIALAAFTALALFRLDLVGVLRVFLFCLAPVAVELINTSFELIVDLRFGTNYREEIRMAKDMLSAAVFLTLVISYGSSMLLIFFQ